MQRLVRALSSCKVNSQTNLLAQSNHGWLVFLGMQNETGGTAVGMYVLRCRSETCAWP